MASQFIFVYSNIIKQQYDFTAKADTTTATYWSVDISTSGYSPIAFSVYNGNSLDIKIGVEWFDNGSIRGFYTCPVSSDVHVVFCIIYLRE